MKYFDVATFDLSHMVPLQFTPQTACWANLQNVPTLLVAENESTRIHVFRGNDAKNAKARNFEVPAHRGRELRTLLFNEKYGCCLSVCSSGVMEYWDATTGLWPESGRTSASSKAGTSSRLIESKLACDKGGLYSLQKSKTAPIHCALSPNCELVAMLCEDERVRVILVLLLFRRGRGTVSIAANNNLYKVVVVAGGLHCRAAAARCGEKKYGGCEINLGVYGMNYSACKKNTISFIV